MRPAGAMLALASIAVAIVLFVLPLGAVAVQAFADGLPGIADAFTDPDLIAALLLSLSVALASVVANTVFGVAAAWCLTKQDFFGRRALAVLVELPLSVSPVISGLVWSLLFGIQGWFGTALQRHGVQIIFAWPGLVLATLFVTLPFVARPLVPLMEAQGREQEEAAVVLGAGFWSIFCRVTLPQIRFGLLSGILMCNARAMGEFGAVSVVSGHIPGVTETLPLRIEALYNDYQAPAAFACAGLLAGLALLTLAAKAILEGAGNRKSALPA